MPAIHNNPPPGVDSPNPDPEPPPAQEMPKKTPDVSQFPRPPRAPYTPQCTHVNMTRAYGATCQNCNRKSPLGWVWQCTYDEGDDPWTAVKGRQSAVDACDPSDRIGVMKALQFHQSVIDQAENGLYTPEQIERLISQKQKVLDTINSQSPDKVAQGNVEQSEVVDIPTLIANLVRQEIRTQLSSASATTVAKERAKHARTVHPRCRYKCCQSCRGDFRGRAFESFDAVFNGEVKPLRLADISALPFRSRESAQARAFYKVEPVNELGMYESMHFNDFSFRRSVRNSVSLAVKHVFGKRRDSSSDGSAVTLPVARSTKSFKNMQDSGLSLPGSFFSPRNTSISAVAPSTIMREGIPTPAPTCSSSSNSSIVDDDGGVSLAEESARQSTPGPLPQTLITQA
ncbi:hypothetical protein BFW01_g10525 [Lasiodiplodia theobromae]|uniref:Uncharacterized protein n=1 Tax=Lasiodiplodia theobromae TaxID=45133 RepID=A0A8H7IPB7_9PEZI|nr:hypothetical protein BFW01_g10525 [Lasiodiplodia theobromae]